MSTPAPGGLRFGLIVNGDEPAGREPAAILADQVERAVHARDAGVRTIAAAHRYSYGPAGADHRGEPLTTWRLQPLLLLAHLAAELRDTVDYATSILLSTSAHPVQLAEEAATLDTLCRGRLRLGVGLGWMPYEFEAFGVDPARRGERFTELLRVYRALLTEPAVTYHGRHFTVDNARLLARGPQRPMPPLWVGASSDPAVRRAADLGDAWVMSAHIDLPTLRRQRELFTARRRARGLPEPGQWPIVRMLVVAEDRGTALREVRPLVEEWYRRRGEWGWFVTRDPAVAVRELGSDRWIVGDPDDCVAQLRRLRDELAVTDVILATPWPDAGREQRLRTIALLGRHVIPAFRDAVPAAAVPGAAGTDDAEVVR
jgi:alkanesulfonate monooxygenase SsuD/methylene tetrahydromethanopterin reductase-like flavin-dependent oxidoreductase (luciferase family)